MSLISAIDSVLFPEGSPIPEISPCDHYAGNEKLILKSLEIQKELKGAFDITCDLEDGASVGNEETIRKRASEIIASSLNQFKKAGVRLHDYESPHFGEDLKTVMRSAGRDLSHITVPKITGAAQARKILEAIRAAEIEHAIRPSIPVHLLIETHAALHEVWEIAAIPGVRCLDFGLMDFVSAHHGALGDTCMQSPAQFEHPIIARAKTELSSAALAHGVIPSHNVTTDFTDPDRVFGDALRARTQFGFLRMWSIHPVQIRPILQAFAPDPNEIAKAAEILLAAKNASWAPIRHSDRLHDRASYRYYWSTIKRALRAGRPLPQALLQS